MQLKRESVKDNEVKGKWLFYIHDTNEALLEKVEDILSNLECSYSINGQPIKWKEYCDCCPLYNEGTSSGFWIPIEDVEEFKQAWKQAKKMLK